MFDRFFRQIETELGPLNSDWFEELTVRACEDGHENCAVVEDEASAQEDHHVFKAPDQTPGLDSQMCSTPRIFRRRWPYSPASGLEDTPNSDLLDTPTGLTTQASSAQRICESLGAQLNPDLSWSSSFNTPSALTPTVILSKTEGQSSPVSFLRDKEVIIVRKLFPSLSINTESTSSERHNGGLTDGTVQAAEQKSDSSSDPIEGVWRQTVPDAIKDGELRNTVESVLDGADDVLSFFFTNSGSSLRRVKSKERKKRANSVVKEVNSTPGTTDHTTGCSSAPKTGTRKSPLFSSQLVGKDFTQWTPLSLSDVQEPKTKHVCRSETSNKLAGPHVDSTVKSDDGENPITQPGLSSSCTSEQPNLSPDSCHEKSQGRISLSEASPALTFSRKPRKFVYRVQNSESKTDAVAEKHYQESSLCDAEDAQTDDDDHLVKPAEGTVEQDHPGHHNTDHDLDMTQLCKAFAEEFTQELNLLKTQQKNAQSSNDSVLIPTCTTMEVTKVQTKTEPVTQREAHVDRPAAEISHLTNVQSFENTVCDSGCPTVPSGFSLETLPCSGANHLYSGFKTANNAVIVVPPEALMKAKAALDQSLQPMTHTGTSSLTEPIKAAGEKLPSESYQHGHEAGKETLDENVFSSADNIPSTVECQTNESGFKTASNRSITVSSVNLEKAEDIFMELDDGRFDSCLSTNKTQVLSEKEIARPSKFDLKNPRKSSPNPARNDDGSSSLTASQRVDVTELCSMLEEAGSQCEFTQFKHTNSYSKCPESLQLEREWDPEIIAGIDFDDSFNCDSTERQVSKKHQSKTAVHSSVPNSGMNKDVAAHSINIWKPSEMLKTADNNVQETSFCFGFKTAKGNDVTISEKCLSKARSVLADIEDTGGNFGVENDRKADTVKRKEKPSTEHVDMFCRIAVEPELALKPGLNLCNGNASPVMKETGMCTQMGSEANLETLHGTLDQQPPLIPSKSVNFGFSTAGGKKLKISEKALQNAKKLLNEVATDDESRHDNSPAGAKASSLPSGHNSSDVLADVVADLKMSDGFLPNGQKEHTFENSPDIKQAMYRTPRPAGSNGFKMAGDKEVSASSIQKSKTIFKDINGGRRSLDETKTVEDDAKLDLEGDAGQRAFGNGFKMASGKGVGFSEKSFMKAKTFLKNCDLDREDISQIKGDDTSVMDDCGFEAAAGNLVNLPGMDSLNKETLKKDSTDLNKNVRRKCTKISSETLQPPSGWGFSTASGAAVSVSTEALQRAKAMLDDSNAVLPGERRLETSEEMSLSKNTALISVKTGGFSTASGRKVAISEKALQNAKTLFTDCDAIGLGPDACNLSAAKTSAAGSEHVSILPFNAASNKNIAVSEKELNKGKGVFVACDDDSDEPHRQYSSEALCAKHESMPGNAGKAEGSYENMTNGPPKVDHLGSGNVGFSTAGGKGVCVSKSALNVAFEMFRDCDARPVTNGRGKTTDEASSTNITKKPVVPKTKATNPSPPSQATQDNPSLLSRHSLNLDGCTVTQQQYFEQEAMACTKALLEDDLNENGLSSSLDTNIRQNPTQHQETGSEVSTGIRKRPPDDERLKGQPPLKRRLVAEFDQISDDRTACGPVKSSPNGTLKDRRVFQYNLKPNVTYPSRNVEDRTSTNQDHFKSRTSDTKAPVFIPPFQKNLIAGTSKIGVPAAVAKAPSVFVPPSKKKDASDHVYVKDSSLTSGDSPAITSSSCKSSRYRLARKPEAEETKREEKLENHTTVPGETNLIWQQSLELAQDMQNMRIGKKKRQRVRPLPGTLYLAKTSGVSRVSLKEAVGYKCPELHAQDQLYRHGVSSKVSQITSENAESFRFSCDEYFNCEVLKETGGIQLADGGWLIPDSRGMLGKEEFHRALCDTPGVDPKLISEAWVYNHYRWVVWKRASMERAFPDGMGGRCLTPEQVLLQLKLRYDVEVDHSRRSALKKIMERDDTPAKTMVLCVCGMAKSDQSPARSEKATADTKPESTATVIWLTDGWYSIKALLDLPLSNMLRKGRLDVGVKLLIHGAELIGSPDACTPLEAPDSLMLKISANSTRRARWETKLGFHKDPRPFPLLLSSLYANGGVVSCVDIIVLRSYPTQWMEKKPGSFFVFRNERAEDREAARYNSTKQKTMELLFSKIQAQIEEEEEEKKKTRRRRTFSLQEIKNMQEGEELHEAMERDPASVEAHLSTQQVKAVSNYRRAFSERNRAELHDRVHKAVQEADGGCANRDVTPVWKLSIADSNDLHSNCVYTLNIWRPSVELRSSLREGCRYKAYHLATSETKKRSSNIQFTATKKTQFQDLEVCPEWSCETSSKICPARRAVKFRDLQNPGFRSPCGEVDLVGYVTSILDRQGTSPVLYLVDEKFDFVSVRICSSLALLALEDLVKPLALLAVSNLQLRQQSGPVPSLYAGEQALFSTSPKEARLQEDISRLNTFAGDYEHFFIVAEEKLSNLIPTGFLNSCESPRTPGLPTVPKPNPRNNANPHPTGRVFSPFAPVTKRTPITPENTDTKDPRGVKRKRCSEYLSRLQNPSPLIPLGVVHSPRVSKTFNPPRRCQTPRNPQTVPTPAPENKQWVNDEEMAMINTQTLLQR